MKNREVKQKRVDQLISDAAYLQKEAEALKYVIDEVPYDATPPEEFSIAEILMLMDHAQCSYYSPVIDEIINTKRAVRLHSFKNYKDTFSVENNERNIQKTLHLLTNHRSSLLNKLKDIPINKWGKISYKDNKEISLADIVEQMNHDDQVHLKKITNLVQSYHQEKNTQREIKQRQKRQQNTKNNKG